MIDEQENQALAACVVVFAIVIGFIFSELLF